MDNFNEIIKQKANQFDVPYNEAHWAEMDKKLTSIRATKIKKNIFGSIAAFAIIAIGSYFMFSNNNNIEAVNDNVISENQAVEEKSNEVLYNPNNETVIGTNDIIEINIVADEEKSIEAIEEKSFEPNENVEEKTVESKISSVKNDKNTSEKATSANNLVNAEFIVYNNKVCLGEIVSFESMENDQPVSYEWNFGDGTRSFKTNPKHIYKSSRKYTVTLTLRNRQTGEETTTKQYDIVAILPLPKTTFAYSEESKKHDDNALKYPYTIFNVKGADNENSYEWKFENGEKSSASETKIIFKEAGDYNVNLIVTNSYGCSTTFSKKINIKNGSSIYVQDAFRPSSSIAENETFIPKALLEWDVKFEMIILNNASKMVYKTSDSSEPWNGKMNNTGQLLDEGIYMWQISTYDAYGNTHRHHGKIHLIK